MQELKTAETGVTCTMSVMIHSGVAAPMALLRAASMTAQNSSMSLMAQALDCEHGAWAVVSCQRTQCELAGLARGRAQGLAKGPWARTERYQN